MEYQLIRQLGATRYGGASIGECLALARRIESGVPASWVAEFAATAARQETDARQRAARRHTVSARDQYLVACNSYRAAEYYTGIADPQHAVYGLKSRECFLAAMQLQDDAFEIVSLPFGDTPLPAYYLRPAKAAADARKTLMIVSGYDGTLEETWLAYGRAALERGYQVLLFAGPGQMDTMRFHPKLPFIPDTERVAAVALDYLLARPETDPARVALMGISFGGYFATRMAAHEPRIRALIANSPIVDLHAYMASFIGFDPAQMPDAEDFRVADIEHIPAGQASPQTREMMRNLMLRFGQDSFKQTYVRLREFRVDERDLATIRCPALGLVGSGEGAEPIAQFERFRRQVAGAAGYTFSAEEGAEGHCQSGNLAYSAAVALDWLDETLA
ncbi:MAG: prolyl oligopeptidase family serine peptidase [Sulfuricella sp.]|nr:prolyl oligopeptidase family serine peptidase [Sulfuricella sp.]